MRIDDGSKTQGAFAPREASLKELEFLASLLQMREHQIEEPFFGSATNFKALRAPWEAGAVFSWNHVGLTAFLIPITFAPKGQCFCRSYSCSLRGR